MGGIMGKNSKDKSPTKLQKGDPNSSSKDMSKPHSPSQPLSGTLRRKFTLLTKKEAVKPDQEDDEEGVDDDITEEERTWLEAAINNKELKRTQSTLEEIVKRRSMRVIDPSGRSGDDSLDDNLEKALQSTVTDIASMFDDGELSPRSRKISELEEENVRLRIQITDLQLMLQATKTPPVSPAVPRAQVISVGLGFHEVMAKQEKEKRAAELKEIREKTVCDTYEDNPFKPNICRACKHTKKEHEERKIETEPDEHKVDVKHEDSSDATNGQNCSPETDTAS